MTGNYNYTNLTQESQRFPDDETFVSDSWISQIWFIIVIPIIIEATENFDEEVKLLVSAW